jgi:hypothetical protein
MPTCIDYSGEHSRVPHATLQRPQRRGQSAPHTRGSRTPRSSQTVEVHHLKLLVCAVASKNDGNPLISNTMLETKSSSTTFTQADSRLDFNFPPWRRSYSQRRRRLHYPWCHDGWAQGHRKRRTGLSDHHWGQMKYATEETSCPCHVAGYRGATFDTFIGSATGEGYRLRRPRYRETVASKAQMLGGCKTQRRQHSTCGLDHAPGTPDSRWNV